MVQGDLTNHTPRSLRLDHIYDTGNTMLVMYSDEILNLIVFCYVSIQRLDELPV